MPSKSKDGKYTDPELKNEVKEEIQESDKGGAPGQWSARKAQMMASKYKKRGGGYTTDKKNESAKHLDNWTKEEWQTKEGSGNAKQEDRTEKRYLPKKAWEQMSEQEKEETDQKKLLGRMPAGALGMLIHKCQTAQRTRMAARRIGKITTLGAARRPIKISRSRTDMTRLHRRKLSRSRDLPRMTIRSSGHPRNADEGRANHQGPNKKAKTGSSSKEPQGTAGDKTRVPKVGQRVQWHALPGYVDGEVVEVVWEQKTVEGKAVKANPEDPRIVLKSSSLGKIAVHKPEAVYFD
ncbi:hypothetical protein BU23DRAFT_566896 [Bimuria novae-zelandiae CBS 107.79]|uniref:Hypervirulence associated protein TUDOR domain-containing protein n=1 Tax=Bimuria novae-zelandiae CBS 107.79 TaxID=1447943 RepID=A0A6A5VK25_9PLEO|nr:hypothetical protein BU23DRAFT_566896 [Bimuria novae-zelandiae CBS 107.79]